MPDETKIYHVDQKYKVQFERSAVKGQDGFKVEINGDNLEQTLNEAEELYKKAIHATMPIIAGPAVEEKKGETK